MRASSTGLSLREYYLMIETLRIVRGAVSTKDFVPILTHVAVHEGRVHAFDGRVAISAPIDLPRSLSFTVPLIPFVAALEACEGAKIKIVHKDESVTVTAGTFRATLPTGKIADFPLVSRRSHARRLTR